MLNQAIRDMLIQASKIESNIPRGESKIRNKAIKDITEMAIDNHPECFQMKTVISRKKNQSKLSD